MDKQQRLNPRPNHIYVIGAGGIGSQLAVNLALTLRSSGNAPLITVMDNDKLEERNLIRQLFSREDIGQPKSEALANHIKEIHPVVPVVDWFTDGFDVKEDSLFFVCVDNHPARRAVLNTVDRTHGWAIIGANEYTDEEAYFYSSKWQGTEIDPRVYYPDLLTSQADDPTMPCTGAIQEAAPQLAIANMGAAFYMLKLFWFYFYELHKLDKEAEPVWPIRFSSNFSRCMTARRSDFTKPAVV